MGDDFTQQRYETFTVLINRISRSIRKIKNQEMAEYRLKSVHVSCLYYLYSVGSMTSSALCDYCEEDKAAISRCVEYLEKNGYLICQLNHQKRYNSPLVLTEKGERIGRSISEKINEVLDSVGSSLSETERLSLYHSLSIISEGLTALATPTRKKEQAK